MLGDDAGDLFAWLRTLPFIDEGPDGLFPHDVARDGLLADLRWRDPGRYAYLHHRVRARLLARFHVAADERERLRLLADSIACQVFDALTRDDTAWTVVGAYADAELWGPTMEMIDFWRAADADYTIGGTDYPVFAHDWRRTDSAEWWELVAAREVGTPTRPTEEHPENPLLSPSEFAAAVRSALRDLAEPRRLRENPLLRSRVVRQHARAGVPPATTLRELLERAVGTLRPDLGEVVDRTFLRPTTTQERVAAALHVSFSTYRRRRDRAVAQICDWLWEREIGHRTTTGSPVTAPPARLMIFPCSTAPSAGPASRSAPTRSAP